MFQNINKFWRHILLKYFWLLLFKFEAGNMKNLVLKIIRYGTNKNIKNYIVSNIKNSCKLVIVGQDVLVKMSNQINCLIGHCHFLIFKFGVMIEGGMNWAFCIFQVSKNYFLYYSFLSSRGSYPPIPMKYSADIRILVSQLLKRNPR